MCELTTRQAEALEFILSHKRAWPGWATMTRRYGVRVLAELLDAGLIVRWDRPRHAVAVLTCYGTWVTHAVVEEHWEKKTVLVDAMGNVVDRNARRKLRCCKKANGVPKGLHKEKRAVESPHWERTGSDKAGDQIRNTVLVRMGGIYQRRERPFSPPPVAPGPAMVPIEMASQVADPSLGPEYLLDFETGKTARLKKKDEAKAATLFRVGAADVGIPVKIDPRINGSM